MSKARSFDRRLNRWGFCVCVVRTRRATPGFKCWYNPNFNRKRAVQAMHDGVNFLKHKSNMDPGAAEGMDSSKGRNEEATGSSFNLVAHARKSVQDFNAAHYSISPMGAAHVRDNKISPFGLHPEWGQGLINNIVGNVSPPIALDDGGGMAWQAASSRNADNARAISINRPTLCTTQEMMMLKFFNSSQGMTAQNVSGLSSRMNNLVPAWQQSTLTSDMHGTSIDGCDEQKEFGDASMERHGQGVHNDGATSARMAKVNLLAMMMVNNPSLMQVVENYLARMGVQTNEIGNAVAALRQPNSGEADSGGGGDDDAVSSQLLGKQEYSVGQDSGTPAPPEQLLKDQTIDLDMIKKHVKDHVKGIFRRNKRSFQAMLSTGSVARSDGGRVVRKKSKPADGNSK